MLVMGVLLEKLWRDCLYIGWLHLDEGWCQRCKGNSERQGRTEGAALRLDPTPQWVAVESLGTQVDGGLHTANLILKRNEPGVVDVAPYIDDFAAVRVVKDLGELGPRRRRGNVTKYKRRPSLTWFRPDRVFGVVELETAAQGHNPDNNIPVFCDRSHLGELGDDVYFDVTVLVHVGP